MEMTIVQLIGELREMTTRCLALVGVEVPPSSEETYLTPTTKSVLEGGMNWTLERLLETLRELVYLQDALASVQSKLGK